MNVMLGTRSLCVYMHVWGVFHLLGESAELVTCSHAQHHPQHGRNPISLPLLDIYSHMRRRKEAWLWACVWSV